MRCAAYLQIVVVHDRGWAHRSAIPDSTAPGNA